VRGSFCFNPQPQKERKNNTMENITLYYREGPSDKVYQAGIQPKDGGFIPNSLPSTQKAFVCSDASCPLKTGQKERDSSFAGANRLRFCLGPRARSSSMAQTVHQSPSTESRVKVCRFAVVSVIENNLLRLDAGG